MLVVGAGPVGLTLAVDLAQRGIRVLVAETRYPGEPPNVKCNHVAARSMEIFRRPARPAGPDRPGARRHADDPRQMTTIR
jgi:2-polyprenyl-6-methoxyphenol hydroxylase-like FAD-dependent oxidoreductase